MTQNIEELYKERVSEKVVAGVLELICAVPNKRDKPHSGDLEGRFDFWFDGGACIVMTGWYRYEFRDGVVADVGSCLPALSVTIRFPDGRRVDIQQKQRKN
jgi:hypothetical protein